MSPPVALIIGAGKNIGASVAKAFTANGYRVAVASRKDNLAEPQYLFTSCDLADPASVEKAFDTVRDKLGQPSVVIYNASYHIGSSDRNDPLGLPLSDLQKTLTLNVSSVYVAAQQAVASFERAAPGSTKAFIYTGNRCNIAPIVPLFSLGVGKSATAGMLAYLSKLYEKKGFKFYYADERTANGSAVYNEIDGPAAGEFYSHLAKGDETIPWLATFVKGHGYKDFEEISKL